MGLFNDLFGGLLTNVYEGSVLPLIQTPQNLARNYTAHFDAALTSAKGEFYPDESFKPGGANEGKIVNIGSVGNGSAWGGGEITYRVLEDVTITTGAKYGTPFTTELKAGDIITYNAAGNQATSRIGPYSVLDIHQFTGAAAFNTRIQDPFLGANGQGRDINGDGWAERMFTNDHGQDWLVMGKSPDLLQRYSNNTALDQRNWNFLPRQLQNSNYPGSYSDNTGNYISSIGDKEWLRQSRPMTMDGLKPGGIFSTLYPNGMPPGYPGAYHYNTYGPGQYLTSMQNTASIFNGPITTTRLKAVDDATLNSDATLQSLRNWLAANWTYEQWKQQANGGQTPQFNGKALVNAYTNQYNELVVEYA